MNNITYENNIDFFISGLVSYHLSSRTDITIELLAEKVKLSVSFLRKAVSYNQQKHFNARHLFLISQTLGISVDKLFPSKEGYKLLTNKNISDDDWNKIAENFKIAREDEYEEKHS